jgi:hypothetical protein
LRPFQVATPCTSELFSGAPVGPRTCLAHACGHARAYNDRFSGGSADEMTLLSSKHGNPRKHPSLSARERCTVAADLARLVDVRHERHDARRVQ